MRDDAPAVLRSSAVRHTEIHACHGGEGSVQCRDFLYDPHAPGITLIHDISLEPSVSIGLHQHLGDEEAYVILRGRGRYQRDDEELEVSSGDICLVRHGQRHSLANTGEETMRVIVVCAKREMAS